MVFECRLAYLWAVLAFEQFAVGFVGAGIAVMYSDQRGIEVVLVAAELAAIAVDSRHLD